MGDVVSIKTKKRIKPPNIPEKCYLRFSTPSEDGSGPVYVEWNGVSPQMVIVAEEILSELKSVLFEIIQGDEEEMK